jgi:uncharacterized membrane protein YqjE
MRSEPAETAGEDSSGPSEPLRGLLAAGFDALRTRLDLAAVELELHLLGIVRMLMWGVAAIVCGLLALAFSVTALVAAMWDSHRMLGLLIGSGGFVALTVIFGVVAVRTLRNHPGILEGSLQQLAADQKRTEGPP